MSSYAHIEWIDLDGSGVWVEVAVMRRDDSGNTYFIRLDSLDMVDKQRLLKIVTNRNADNYELWDLMSNVTLGNGCNALTFFHQMVKVLTPSGQIMRPSAGKMGAALPTGAVAENAPTPSQEPAKPAAKPAKK